MATYSVVAHDGNLYGPVDEQGLTEWIRQGRVDGRTILHCHETNARTTAATIPSLQPTLGLSPQQVTTLLNAPLAPLPLPISYAQPHANRQVYGDLLEPRVSPFPVAAAVLLAIFVPLFTVIYYGIAHGDLPKRRPDDPGAGKAIGFMFIPLFNIYWMCFFWIRLCTRLNDERTRVGLPPTAPRGLVIAICWCHLALIIPGVNILALIALPIMMIISLVQIQGCINELAAVTRR